ncbi:hypothetical protein [Streptomyces sp. NPDC088915]|uniref:hypothetical protein n=1 Tax=Streptomyces sp. NPDC088915 TaxID=3365912 RepID=UPI0038016B67
MSSKTTSRRAPWRLALLVPAAAYLTIWRGVPGITPMLTFTWLQALLGGAGVIVAGLYGPQVLAATAKAQKESAARRRVRDEQKALKKKAAKADDQLRRKYDK